MEEQQNPEQKTITINSGISQNSQIFDKSKANSGITNPYASILNNNNSQLKDSDLSNLGKSQLQNFQNGKSLTGNNENNMDPSFRIKEEGGISNITNQNLGSNISNQGQITNNHEEFQNQFKLENSFLRDSNLTNNDNKFNNDYSFGGNSLRGSDLRNSNFRVSQGAFQNSDLRGNSLVSQGFGRQSGGFFNLNGSDVKKEQFNLQSNSQISQDLRMSIQNENNRFSSDLLRPSSEIRMPSDFQNFPSNFSNTSQIGGQQQNKDLFRNSDLSQTKMPQENKQFISNDNIQNEDLSKPLIKDSSNINMPYRISEESSWKEQSHLQNSTIRMSQEERNSMHIANPYRQSDNNPQQGLLQAQGLGQQLEGVDLYRDSKNSIYRNSDINRPFSGDITHFQNQKIEEDVRQSGSVFGGDYRGSEKFRSSNKPFENSQFQAPANRDSIKSRGPGYVNFDDGRNSLEQDYETAKQFNMNNNRLSLGRMSLQNDGGNMIERSNQQMLGNFQSRNVSDRFSNTSNFRPSLNRPSMNNRQSNLSQQSMSFPSFDFDPNQNPSNRTSTQRGSNLTSIQEEKTDKSQVQGCTCTRSKCLKQYCQCFQNQRFCGPTCRCIDCHNNPNNEQHIIHARQQILNRNPEAFNKKLESIDQKNNKLFQQQNQNNIFNNPIVKQQQQLQQSMKLTASQMQGGNQESQTLIYKKGCNCRKTNCLKKYCECYNAGVKCHSLCKCDNCHNQEGGDMETEDSGTRQQSLTQIEIEHTRQKKMQTLSIQQQQQLIQKQQQVNIVGKGIVD